GFASAPSSPFPWRFCSGRPASIIRRVDTRSIVFARKCFRSAGRPRIAFPAPRRLRKRRDDACALPKLSRNATTFAGKAQLSGIGGRFRWKKARQANEFVTLFGDSLYWVSFKMAFMINEHDDVVLTEDVPTEELKAGDIGTVVHIHAKGEAYEVEFIYLDGETIAVVTLMANQVRSIKTGEIAHARELASR